MASSSAENRGLLERTANIGHKLDMVPYHFNSDACRSLYHYTSLVGARGMVESQTIWLSDHAAMNDITEFSHARERLYTLLRNRAVFAELPVRLAVTWMVSGFPEIIGLFIGSLTARRDDLNQWRSYADNGGGCVVEIDARYLEQDAGVSVHTVIYDDETIDHCLTTGLRVLQEHFEEAPDDNEALVEMARCLAASLFVMKHSGFADEREVRVSRMLVRGADNGFVDVGGNRGEGIRTPSLEVRSRQGAFGETSFLALPLRRDDGTSAITGVGLGPTMNLANVTLATAFFAEHGIPVWRSELPYRI